ncbi:MAG TPA: MaoC family dehydratase N-terminal domain-containing protein [Chloroflexota bacterium]
MSEYCERMLAEARRLIGTETRIRWARYPVEYEPIRRWCHMVECDAPPFLDPAYAAGTAWGKVVCPPLMIPIFAAQSLPSRPSSSGPEIDWPPLAPGEEIEEIDPPTPGTRSINLGGETEFLQPVFVGDRLGSARRLADVYIKKIRIDPEAFWLVTDTLYYNQDEQLVAVNHNTLIRHRDRAQIAATTPEQLAELPAP